MYTFVRVEAVSSDGELGPLFFDLVVDQDNVVRAGSPYCGWWGKVRSTDLWPFVTKPHGDGGYRIDFGSDEHADQAARHCYFDLFDAPIMRGRKFHFEFDGERHQFVVKQATDMISGLPRD